jgi:hypothetical protein
MTLGSRGKPVITGSTKRLISGMVPHAVTFPDIWNAGLIAQYNAQ